MLKDHHWLAGFPRFAAAAARRTRQAHSERLVHVETTTGGLTTAGISDGTTRVAPLLNALFMLGRHTVVWRRVFLMERRETGRLDLQEESGGFASWRSDATLRTPVRVMLMILLG
jgi:hypothetical protein